MEPSEPMALTKRQKLVQKLRSDKRLVRFLAVCSVIILAGVGTILLRLSFANTTTTTSNADCGKKVNPYNYQVPFGNAIWNQPICGLPRHPQSADYANRFFEWGHANSGAPEEDVSNGKVRNNPGFPDFSEINPLGKLFTREVYYASKSTTESRIATVSYYSNLDGEDVKTFLPDTKIPWNPKWEASQGGDNELMILDDREGPTKGRIYFLSGYYPENPKFPYRKIPPVGCNAAWEQNRLCTYRTSVARDLQGNYIDYRTYEGFVKDRGVGLSYLATLTLPEEVEAGEIRHALGIAIPNTSFGPICTKSQLGNWSQEGKTCGTAVAPATKFEHGSKTSAVAIPEPEKSLYTLDKTIPEGMLFGLDITYEQIDAWIQSRPDLVSNPRRAETARIFARAMKDYGMMVVDTNGGSPSIQTAGGINPDNAKKWTDLGMGPEQKESINPMFKGLITASNLYVVNPPVATCVDGTKSRYYCDWTSIAYEGSSTDTTKPTVTISNPAANTTVSGVTTISGSASDNVGVNKIEVRINGNVVYSVNANSSYSYSWDTRPLTNGTYTITVNASDVAGNVGTVTRTVTVSNTQPPPLKTADFNKDGKVGLVDLSVLLTNYNKPVAAGTNGDANGDAKVELVDLSILLTQYDR